MEGDETLKRMFGTLIITYDIRVRVLLSKKILMSHKFCSEIAHYFLRIIVKPKISRLMIFSDNTNSLSLMLLMLPVTIFSIISILRDNKNVPNFFFLFFFNLFQKQKKQQKLERIKHQIKTVNEATTRPVIVIGSFNQVDDPSLHMSQI